MSRWQKITLATLGGIGLLLLAAAIILPGIIRTRAIEQVRSDYGRELKIGRIYINPFSLQVDIRKLDLKEPGSDQTFVAFDRLEFSLSLRSLLDRALIIDDLILDRPYVRLERHAAGRFNFSDFLPEKKTAKQPAEPAKPFHFSFNNLQLHQGSLVFADFSGTQPRVHRVEDLNLAVPFVGNIPYLTKLYIQPALSLKLDGSPLAAKGQMKPFDQSVETRLELNLGGIDLPFYAAYLQPVLPFELTNGRLSAQLKLVYQVSAAQKPSLRLSGDLSLSTLRLVRQGKEFFFLPLLLVQIDRIEPFTARYHFAAISIYNPQLKVRRLADGSINLQQMLPPAAPDKAAAAPGKESPLPDLTIGTLRLREGDIDFHDEVPAGGFSSRMHDINLLTQKLTTRGQRPAPLDFGLRTNHGERVSLKGELNLVPQHFSGHFSLQSLPLEAYSPYLHEFLTRTPLGRAGLETDLDVTGDSQRLSNLQLRLHNLRQPLGANDLFQLTEFSLDNAQISLPERQVEIGSLALRHANLDLSRSADGMLPLAGLLRPQPEQAAAGTAANTEPATVSTWQLAMKRFELDDLGARFLDNAAPRPTPLTVEHVKLELTDLHWPESTDSPWQLQGNWGAGGSFAAGGTLHHTPLLAKGGLNLTQLDLRPLNSYIPADIRLQLASARLDSKLDFDLAQHEQFGGEVKGTLGLRQLSLTGAEDDELLRWESLQFDGIKVALQPLDLSIAQVSLNNYLAKIRVDADGRVNLDRITAAEPQVAAAKTPPPPVTTATAPNETSSPLPPLRIDELTLQGGEVSFVDHHLPKVFATTMYQLGGRVSGLSSTPGKFASVDLRGALENHSPLTISGRIAPLAGNLDAELKVRFNQIDLVPATPYAGTYLGYVIAKGKLYLDLDYRIANRQVQASNKLFLDQFTFGHSVESAQATGLPVRLAVALLKDRKGEIHLDLPVSGSTDDPQFGIFSTVMTLLKNLLIKAATSPFRLLAAVLGGGNEDYSQINFAAGTTSLTPGNRELLGKLAHMLDERPALKLEISGFVDLQKDPEGYRRETLRQQVETEWRKNSKAPAGTEIPTAAYLENLTRAYRRAKFPKPRTAFGLLKKLPPAEMEKLILANIRVGDAQLEQLAASRANAVQQELLRQDPDLGTRVFLKNAEIKTPPEKGKQAARVEFSIAVE